MQDAPCNSSQELNHGPGDRCASKHVVVLQKPISARRFDLPKAQNGLVSLFQPDLFQHGRLPKLADLLLLNWHQRSAVRALADIFGTSFQTRGY
jgi:hypothetical protein